MRWKTVFYDVEPGAAPEALARLRAAAPRPLPESFYALLAFSNGGEWPIAWFPGRLNLATAELIEEMCLPNRFKPSPANTFLEGFILFATNGSGQSIGFDIRGAEPWPVVEIDMEEPDLDERVVVIAPDFDAFLGLVGVQS